MEVELMGDTLCLRFDGRTATVSDEEHVAAFKRLLALPNVEELFLQPMVPYVPGSGDDEDYDECPRGFAWFNDGVWLADPVDADQAPWIVIERDDMRNKYESDLAAARDNFAEVRHVLFADPGSCGNLAEFHYQPGSSTGVVIARKPASTDGMLEYANAIAYLPVLVRNNVGSQEQRRRLCAWLRQHHPPLRKDAGP